MPKRVVLFDVDGTLIDPDSLGDETRTLLFPQATKAVIDALFLNGDTIIIASQATKRDDIIKTLQQANIDTDKILEILGRYEIEKVPLTANFEAKTSKALQVMRDQGAQQVVIIDDSLIGEHDNSVCHILVPTPKKTNYRYVEPQSDNYLKVALLPEESLQKISKTIHPHLVELAQKKGYGDLGINDELLNKTYDEALYTERLIHALCDYKIKLLEKDYSTIRLDRWSFFSSMDTKESKKQDKSLHIIRAIDEICHQLSHDTFGSLPLPPQAQLGELARILALKNFGDEQERQQSKTEQAIELAKFTIQKLGLVHKDINIEQAIDLAKTNNCFVLRSSLSRPDAIAVTSYSAKDSCSQLIYLDDLIEKDPSWFQTEELAMKKLLKEFGRIYSTNGQLLSVELAEAAAEEPSVSPSAGP